MESLEKLPKAPEPKPLLNEAEIETSPIADTTERPSTVAETPPAKDTPIKIEYDEPTSISEKTIPESDPTSTPEPSDAGGAEKTPEEEAKPGIIDGLKDRLKEWFGDGQSEEPKKEDK